MLARRFLMGHRFPSAEWVAAYKDAVNGNPAYRVAGKPWTFGPVAMVVQADPTVGLTIDAGMILDVHEGTCRGTRFVEGLDAVQEAPFILVASYAQWKEVIAGGLDPIKAMMQGRLKLVKGHLPTMIRFVESSRQLVVSASHVATDFPA